MKTSDLVFIGIKGSVLALNRATGEQVWVTPFGSGDFVNVVLQHDAVLATCKGEIFCLDPFTGIVCWHNPPKGFGMNLATIATDSNLGTGIAPVLAEQRRCDEEAAAAVAATA